MILPGWSEAAIDHELFVASRRVGAMPADAEVIERAGWSQLRTPSFPRGGFNEVSHSVLGDDEADAIIDETIAGYRERGLSFRWLVGPQSAPADLGERLAARGLSRSDTRGMAIACAPRAVGEGDDEREGAGEGPIQVVRVGPATVDTFTEVSAAGWDLEPGPLIAAHRQMVADPRSRTALFLATYAGEPAAVASVELRARSAFLIGGVVRQEFRGRGLYRALLAARLELAAASGLTLAVTHAIEATSAPILTNFGFQSVARFAFYRFDPTAPERP